jgi:tetratricopeptide (TPR) repeat protein
VDLHIARLHELARAQPRRAGHFIELGRAWVWKARESSDPGYYLNANACADVALDLAPNDRLALELRALVLLNEHRFEEARALAQSMVDREPEAAMAWGSLSDALYELGAFEQAEQAAARMIDLKPNLPSYSRVAYFRWLRGDTDGALEANRLAIDAGRDPKNREPLAWVLVQTAMSFWHRGDYDGADAGFVQALEVVADYPAALVGRGRVALARSKPGEARDFFEHAHRQSPLVETAGLLAQAREAMGDLAGARAAIASAEKEGRAGDRRSLSLLYSTFDIHPAEALRLAEAEQGARRDIYTEDALAFALYRNQRFREAKSAIARAVRHGTPDARLMFHEGAIDLALGEVARGRKLLARALAQNPAFDANGSREARRLLAEHRP